MELRSSDNICRKRKKYISRRYSQIEKRRGTQRINLRKSARKNLRKSARKKDFTQIEDNQMGAEKISVNQRERKKKISRRWTQIEKRRGTQRIL